MSNETTLTIIGRLTAAPELRFTPAGIAVASFTIASNARKFDRQSNEWKDEPPLFMRCSSWRDLAENIAESLDKGMSVIAMGNLQQRDYETRAGEKRTVVELQVEEVGPSLKYATAKVARAVKGGNGPARHSSPQAPGGDPWATTAAPASTARFTDEPPF